MLQKMKQVRLQEDILRTVVNENSGNLETFDYLNGEDTVIVKT